MLVIGKFNIILCCAEIGWIKVPYRIRHFVLEYPICKLSIQFFKVLWIQTDILQSPAVFFKSKSSTWPPVSSFWPWSRAGKTRVSFITRASPGSSISIIEWKWRSWNSPVLRLTIKSLEASRFSKGVWAIKSSGKWKSKSFVFNVVILLFSSHLFKLLIKANFFK